MADRLGVDAYPLTKLEILYYNTKEKRKNLYVF